MVILSSHSGKPKSRLTYHFHGSLQSWPFIYQLIHHPKKLYNVLIFDHHIIVAHTVSGSRSLQCQRQRGPAKVKAEKTPSDTMMALRLQFAHKRGS